MILDVDTMSIELDRIIEQMRKDILQTCTTGTPGGQWHKSRIKTILDKYTRYLNNVKNGKQFDGGDITTNDSNL